MSATMERADARVRLGGAPAFLVVVIAYLLALFAAGFSFSYFAGKPLWVLIAGADVVATLVIFLFSLLLDCSSIYDPYWSIAPMPIVILLALVQGAESVPSARRNLVIFLVFAWALRLTINWIRGWRGFAHEDWRYVSMRTTTGGAYWLVSLFGLHLFPTVTVFLGLLPLFPAFGHAAPLVPAAPSLPFGIVDCVAALVMTGAILLETVADEQLRAFRRAHPNSGPICESGLWGLCRHPNYLGEIGMWWGLVLFGVAAQPSGVWAYSIGAVWITLMFALITIPMIDRRSLTRRPGYADHMRRLHALLPLGRRK